MSLTEDAPGDGDSDPDGSGGGEQDGPRSVDTGDGISTSEIARIVRAILPDWIFEVGPTGAKLVKNPITGVLTIVVGFVFQDIVLPIVRGVLQAGAALIGGILVLAQSILTLGTLLIDGLVGGFAPVGTAILSTVAQINTAIAQVAAEAGLAAPAVVTLLYGIEIGVAGFLVVSLIESIDVPFVDLGGLLRAVTAPFKAVINFVR